MRSEDITGIILFSLTFLSGHRDFELPCLPASPYEKRFLNSPYKQIELLFKHAPISADQDRSTVIEIDSRHVYKHTIVYDPSNKTGVIIFKCLYSSLLYLFPRQRNVLSNGQQMSRQTGGRAIDRSIRVCDKHESYSFNEDKCGAS